jgi:hypothetical protein
MVHVPRREDYEEKVRRRNGIGFVEVITGELD